MIRDLLRNTGKFTHKNSPVIATVTGALGVLATSYLVGSASFKAARLIDEEEAITGTADDVTTRVKERTKLVWKLYIPPVTTGVVTVGAIVYANRAGAKQTATAISAYTLTERAFAEYRNKVVEELGSHKEQVMRDAIAQDTLDNKPVSETVIFGSGEALCCELHTKRYFMSDMETLRRAQNDINARIVNDLYVTLDEFYYLIGLEPTENSGGLGWDSDKLLELQFSTAIAKDGRPCLTFTYNYVKPV
jgi:hypothetical protein